jgi:M6 family metalloprotease-like protein
MQKGTAFAIVGFTIVSISLYTLVQQSEAPQAQMAAVVAAVDTKSPGADLAKQIAQLNSQMTATLETPSAPSSMAPTMSANSVSSDAAPRAAAAPAAQAPAALATNNAHQQQVTLAQKRETLMVQLAQKDPKAFLQSVIDDTTRAQFAADVQAHIEKHVNVQGTVNVIHIDDFDNEANSRFAYTLNSNGKKLPLYLAGSAPAISSRSSVKVDGYQAGQTVVATASTGGFQVLSSPNPAPASVGVQSTLAILITGPGQPVTPTKAQMNKIIFQDQFQKYYQEQSYGKVSFTGAVTDWISISGTYPYSACYGDGSSNPGFETPEVQSYLASNSIDLSKYGRVVFVINQAGGGCAGVGQGDYNINGKIYRLSFAWVGYPNAGYNSSKLPGFQFVLAHEMGHELGVYHANSWECSGRSLDSNCVHSEYGNSFDVMGCCGSSGTHFNAYYKTILGWLTPADEVQITQNGTYTLAPLEATSSIRAAVINNPRLLATDPQVDPVYVEYRVPMGFDSNLPASGNGLHLNDAVRGNTTDTWTFPRLLNANYASALAYGYQSSLNFPLLAGHKFSWPSHGIAIGSLTTTPLLATFTVSLSRPTCVQGNPVLQISAPYSTAVPNSNANYAFVITNTDQTGCPARSFSLTAVVKPVTASSTAGWRVSTYPSTSFLVNNNSYADSMVYLYIPPTAVAGTYNLIITLTDTKSGIAQRYTQAIIIINGSSTKPVIKTITPALIVPGKTLTIKGSGFDSAGSNKIYFVQRANKGDVHYYGYAANVKVVGTGSLSFPFPQMVTDFFTHESVTVPSGQYELSVESTGVESDLAPFTLANFNLQASPSSVVIPAGVATTSTTISWYVPTSTTAQIWTGVPGQPGRLYVCRTGPRTDIHPIQVRSTGLLVQLYAVPSCISTIDGLTPAQSVTVTATQQIAATLTATPKSGTAPLAVTATIAKTNNTDNKYVYRVAFGDGTYSGNFLYDSQLIHTYSTSGTYKMDLQQTVVNCTASSPAVCEDVPSTATWSVVGSVTITATSSSTATTTAPAPTPTVAPTAPAPTLTATDFNLHASPNPAVIPAGGSTTTATISWNLPASVTAQVWYSVPGKPGKLYDCHTGARTLSHNVVVRSTGLVFQLYVVPSCTAAIDGYAPAASVTITATQAIAPTATAGTPITSATLTP